MSFNSLWAKQNVKLRARCSARILTAKGQLPSDLITCRVPVQAAQQGGGDKWGQAGGKMIYPRYLVPLGLMYAAAIATKSSARDAGLAPANVQSYLLALKHVLFVRGHTAYTLESGHIPQRAQGTGTFAHKDVCV